MKRRRSLISAFTVVLIGAIASSATMALEVDSEQSRVSLVSTKILADGTASVTEVFSFNSLAGSVTDEGLATVTIDLGDVDTGIDIRNERMSEFFFEVSEYPEATVTAQIPDSTLEVGNQLMDLQVSVDMHGSQTDYLVPVVINSNSETVSVVATEPVLVDAASFELKGGLAKLGELAGLLHIPSTVPVSFTLSFTR